MNNNNLRKRIIAGGCVGVLVAGVVTTALLHNASDVLAKQNVFHTMKQYQDNGLKVLEITPTSDDIDMGYFFPNKNEPFYSKDATKGNILFKNVVVDTTPKPYHNRQEYINCANYINNNTSLATDTRNEVGPALMNAWNASHPYEQASNLNEYFTTYRYLHDSNAK